LVAVDTETTGLSPAEGHALVEIATVLIADGEIGETWSSLIRPGRPIPADAAAVHGITDAMVTGAPPAATVAAELCRRCGDLPLVFYNASCYTPILFYFLRRTSQAPLLSPIVDTLGLARGLMGTGGNSLSSLATRFGLPIEPRHRALGDALTTARLFLTLVPRWEAERGVRTLCELAAASQDMMRQVAAR